jgi:type VI secretion system protein ImpF
MAESAPNERLLPFLLDRITGNDAGQPEGRDRRVMSMRDFREALLRDLAWLLNAACYRSRDASEGRNGLEAFPAAAKSVINFGMPELAGVTASSIGADTIERIVRNAITTFEPRILPRSLEVSVVHGGEAGGRHVIGIEIRAEAWNVPMPDSLYIRTEVDLETGRFQLNETAQAG